jgi:RimJ/RimL family protein N-acetyltransferase
MHNAFHPDPGQDVGALPTQVAGDATSAAIIALQAEDLAQVEAHLLRLAPQDRSLRFSAGPVTDETIRRYVADIRFDRDALFGLIDAAGSIVAVAHGCVSSVAGRVHVETAFSIDTAWRHQGHSTCLVRAVASFANSEGARTLIAICSARNQPMRHICERAGMPSGARTSRLRRAGVRHGRSA